MVFIAGLVMSLMLLSSWDDLLEPYGLLLMTKATLFALLMLLAALNKWRYTERIFAGEEAAAAAFRTVVVLEWIGIAIVIVVTSFMTGLFAPDG
jgi:putative copper export protein